MRLPLELERFLAEPRIAVLATVRGDGAPATTACWYDLEQGRLLITMYASARRLPNIRRNPRVAMTILGEDPYQHVSLSGSVPERRSGRPGESHPRAPTDPSVTVSRHRALLTSRQ